MVMERTRMNTKRGVTWGLLAGAVACMAMAAMPGCELLVDFDRSKIPTEDASLFGDGGETPDAPASADAPGEGNNTAPPVPDAAVDGGADGGADGGDGGDSAATAPETSTPDTGTDATNVVDTGTDSGPDAVVDAALDAE
jgi:hypothetical protein